MSDFVARANKVQSQCPIADGYIDEAIRCVERLEEALRPFAEYGRYMENREPGWYDRGMYYGVKHPKAPQIKRSDFRRAAEILAREVPVTRHAIRCKRTGQTLAMRLDGGECVCGPNECVVENAHRPARPVKPKDGEK